MKLRWLAIAIVFLFLTALPVNADWFSQGGSAPTTVDEINAGTITGKYISPSTIKNSKYSTTGALTGTSGTDLVTAALSELAIIQGVIYPSASGTFTLQGAQNVSHADTTIINGMATLTLIW